MLSDLATNTMLVTENTLSSLFHDEGFLADD